MTERAKIVILILSQTVVTAFEYGIEAILGEFADIDLKTFVSMLLNFSLYIVFGFFTENVKKLFIYSMVLTLVNTIFGCSDMYFNLNRYEGTLQLYGNSLFILFAVATSFIFILSIIFIGLGMILSYLFNVIFKKQADKL